MRHPWPGNVRELHNVLLRASVMTDSATIRAVHLELSTPGGCAPGRPPRTRRQFEAKEAEQLFALLQTHQWNISEVARTLGTPRNTLYRELKKAWVAATVGTAPHKKVVRSTRRGVEAEWIDIRRA